MENIQVTAVTNNDKEQMHFSGVTVNFVGPVLAILIRSLNAFIGSITGLLSVGAVTSTLIPAADFFELLGKCASLSVGIAGTTALINIGKLLTKLEQKYPTMGA